jgi:hypothetical protein
MKDFTQEDKAMRKQLEARSINEGRANVADSLNKLAAGDAFQRVAEDALMALRSGAQGRARTVNDLNARHDALLARAAVDASYVSPLRAPKLPGADGSMQGGNSDHWSGQGVKTPEPRFLTIEQMKVVAAVKAMMSRYY